MSYSVNGTAVWVGQAAAPPLVDQAREAYGQIVLPGSTLSFSPTGRTFVNMDTWFWAQGLDGKELQGSSALGLVAFATPGHLSIDPGDGSGPLTCTWVTSKSDRCVYPYRRASLGGSARGVHGAPAYGATGHAVWKLRFELNDKPVDIEGAPKVLSGEDMKLVPVEVDEIQTVVIG